MTSRYRYNQTLGRLWKRLLPVREDDELGPLGDSRWFERGHMLSQYATNLEWYGAPTDDGMSCGQSIQPFTMQL